MAKQVFRIFKAAAVGTTAATLADKLKGHTPTAAAHTAASNGEAPPPPTLDALAEAIRRARGGK